jgi:hypothetical protein
MLKQPAATNQEPRQRDSAKERFFDRWLTRAITTVQQRSFMKSARGCLLAANRTPEVRGGCLLVIEGLSMLGEQSQAGQLYPLAREFVSTGGVVLLPFYRFTQTIARCGSGASLGSCGRALSDRDAAS